MAKMDEEELEKELQQEVSQETENLSNVELKQVVDTARVEVRRMKESEKLERASPGGSKKLKSAQTKLKMIEDEYYIRAANDSLNTFMYRPSWAVQEPMWQNTSSAKPPPMAQLGPSHACKAKKATPTAKTPVEASAAIPPASNLSFPVMQGDQDVVITGSQPVVNRQVVTAVQGNAFIPQIQYQDFSFLGTTVNQSQTSLAGLHVPISHAANGYTLPQQMGAPVLPTAPQNVPTPVQRQATQPKKGKQGGAASKSRQRGPSQATIPPAVHATNPLFHVNHAVAQAA